MPVGELGDIYVKTTHAQEVKDILTLKKKIEQPKNYKEHHVYYRADDGWNLADSTRRDSNGIPCTKHPDSGIKRIALEVFSFTWRHDRNYYNGNNRGILDSIRETVKLSIGTGNENLG